MPKKHPLCQFKSDVPCVDDDCPHKHQHWHRRMCRATASRIRVTPSGPRLACGNHDRSNIALQFVDDPIDIEAIDDRLLRELVKAEQEHRQWTEDRRDFFHNLTQASNEREAAARAEIAQRSRIVDDTLIRE